MTSSLPSALCMLAIIAAAVAIGSATLRPACHVAGLRPAVWTHVSDHPTRVSVGLKPVSVAHTGIYRLSRSVDPKDRVQSPHR